MSTINPIINIVPGDFGGCGYYRLIQVGNQLQLINKDVTISSPCKFRAYSQDVIYTQRLCSEKSLKPILDFKNKTGVKVIVDFDDLIWNYKGEGLPEYNYCRTKVDCDGNTEAMKKYANDVIDKASVTTEPLKEALSQFIDPRKITVLPNRLSIKEWLFDHPTTIPEEDIFFFAGSNTHYDNANKKPGDFSSGLIKYLNNKKIITMGVVPYFMKPAAHFQGCGLNTYAQNFHNIARKAKFVIAPLADNFFNKCKSPLKLLECAAVGRVCLCTDFEGSPYSQLAHEYQKVPVNATAQTIEYIVERAKKHYGEILQHQYNMLQNYWLDNHLQEYVDFLK